MPQTELLDPDEWVVGELAAWAYNIAPTYGWDGAHEHIAHCAEHGLELEGPCHFGHCDCDPDTYSRRRGVLATPEQIGQAVARAQAWARGEWAA